MGVFEIEYADPTDTKTLTVTEVKAPKGTPPAGWKQIDPAVYQVSVKEGTKGIEFQAIHYRYDISSQFIPSYLLFIRGNRFLI